MTRGKIKLEGMRFACRHGVLESEMLAPNIFVVDFSADYDISEAARSDRLEDTLDYGEIYGIVAEQMRHPSALLEHLCARIVSAIADAHPEMGAFTVQVSKRNPPVEGMAEWSRVEINYTR